MLAAVVVESDIDVAEHVGLVYHVLHNYGIQLGHKDWDDCFSAGQFGLFKAQRTYRVGKGTQFATYALTCIRNELKMLFRKNESRGVVYSLNTEFRNSAEETCTLEDILPDNTDYFGDIEVWEMVKDLLTGDFLNPTEKNVICIILRNPTIRQSRIGEKVGHTQSYVSRLIKQLRQKLIERGDICG
jgi:RNA polymerase sporulation-specific sigma factor